jgi:DNA polymerase III epsilon subunit-like protein
VQLAYVVVEGGELAAEYESLLRLPVGHRVSAGAQEIHGISTKEANAQGADPKIAIREFWEMLNYVWARGGRVVSHNIKFDMRAFNYTAQALGLTGLEVADSWGFCTMVESYPYSTLKTKNGRRKAFKNEELYYHLYGTRPDWAKLHDALSDVRITLLNYSKGKELGWW